MLACGLSFSVVAADKDFVMPTTWSAYFKDPEKGKLKNIQEPIEKIDTKTWLGLNWTEYKGAKLSLAVMPADNNAATAPVATGNGAAAILTAMAVASGANLNQVPVNAIETLVASSLQATNRFRLFDRSALMDISAEKNLTAGTQVAQIQTDTPAAKSGNPADEKAAIQESAAKLQNQTESLKAALSDAANAIQRAKLMGAQYLVYASVVEWTPNKSSKNIGAGAASFTSGMLGALGGSVGKNEAEVVMNFRIVDANTGEVKWSIDERATAGKWGFSLGLFGMGDSGAGAGSGGMQEKTPISYAAKACINKAIYRIAQTLKDMQWQGAIARATTMDKIIINAGKDAGLEPGMILSAESVGEVIKDPVTGEVLDSETVPAGKIVISSVKDRVAYGSLMDCPAGVTLKSGDRVTLKPTNNELAPSAPKI